MRNVKNTILDSLLAVVAPHLCSACGQIGTTFCDNCKYNIVNTPFTGCIKCEKPTSRGICDEHKAAFNQAWVVGFRSGALQRLVGNYKFQNMKEASVALADLLDRTLPALPRNTMFVPIPTVSTHIRERGYDHMLLITLQLARKRHLPALALLERAHQHVQHTASREKRIAQAATAFNITGYVDPNAIYILVDDVFTTGATLEQASLLLKNAGATVWVAVIAKQPLD